MRSVFLPYEGREEDGTLGPTIEHEQAERLRLNAPSLVVHVVSQLTILILIVGFCTFCCR